MSFVFAGFFKSIGIVGIATSLLLVFITSIMVLLKSLYRTRYILTDKDSKMIGGSKTIPLPTINSVVDTPYPLGVRLFGASFHGRY